ncbi:MAG TPA: SH3 domain-containing protein [Candidatus Margulisiibacteriota bacterium]|nr:SH3 domain-containing protein [Candidatus Margulisiibacteriota bacterium]
MEDRRRYGRRRAARWYPWCVLLFVVTVRLSFVDTAAWGQGSTVVVTGTKRVMVRRGPGTGFPPFAALTKGSVVEVLEMRGEWARVKTAGGQVGYVRSNFLALPNEGSAAAATETPLLQPTATPSAPPTARVDSAALHTLTERNKALEAQVSALQDELTALKNRPTQTAQPAPTSAPVTGEAEELRKELKRLTAAVEGLQKRVSAVSPSNDAPAASAPSTEAPEHNVSPTALVLGAIGLLLGWVGGITYGRTQDRGRRSRIRF